jgi:protein ImuB
MGKPSDMASRISERYGCLVLGQFAAQALLRLRAKTSAVAVMDGLKPWEVVCALNGAAQRAGIQVGMTRLDVEAFDGVETARRSQADERSTVAAVLTCLGQFSPRIEVRKTPGADWECIVDLSGTELLLGKPEVLGAALLKALEQVGVEGWLVLGANADAGLSVARFLAAQSLGSNCQGVRCQTIAAGGEKRALQRLPVGVLGLDKGQSERLVTWGIGTLGELAELDEESLILRMGQAGKTLRLRAIGQFRELLQPLEEMLSLEETLEFSDPLETIEQMLFCLSPMLERLLAYAGERALAIASVRIALTLAACEDRVDGSLLESTPETVTRTIRPAIATTDRMLLLKLIQLDLEAHPIAGAVAGVVLRAETGDPSRIQLGLFAPQLPEPTRFEDTYARLAAVVGETNLGRLRALDTHAREGFRLDRFILPTHLAKPAPARSADSVPAMALRRMRPPAQVKVWVVNRRVESFMFDEVRYRVARSYGPWRMSGEWWSPQVWSYDAWDIAAVRVGNETDVLLCMLGFDLLRNRWQMEGLYD